MSSLEPNILLIFVDNQPANMMGCYGNDEIFTPHLDELASKGCCFAMLSAQFYVLPLSGIHAHRAHAFTARSSHLA